MLVNMHILDENTPDENYRFVASQKRSLVVFYPYACVRQLGNVPGHPLRSWCKRRSQNMTPPHVDATALVSPYCIESFITSIRVSSTVFSWFIIAFIFAWSLVQTWRTLLRRSRFLYCKPTQHPNILRITLSRDREEYHTSMLLLFFLSSRWQRSYALVRDTVMISFRTYLLHAQPSYGWQPYPNLYRSKINCQRA